MKVLDIKSHVRLRGVTCLAVALMLGAGPAFAQGQVNEQTGIADPGRIQEQFRDSNLMPQVGPNVTVKEMKLQGAPAGAENVRLTFGGVRFQGNSVFSDSQLAQVYSDRIGEEMTLADVYGIANQLTLKYRNAGYILTQVVVPPQTIQSGVVDLQVVEGYVDNIVIQAPEDETPEALALIRDYAAQISTGGALNTQHLERELLLINDLPGVFARSILSPSRTQAGAADLLIIVERDPFDAMVGVDNFGSRYLGPVQVSGAVTLNSWLGYNDAITAQTVIAPDSGYELAFGSVSYEMPVGTRGTRVKGLISVTDTEPGYDLDRFDVRGHSTLLSLQATHPFIRSRTENLTGRVLFDWRDVRSQNALFPTLEDRIRVVRAGGRYEFMDRLFGVAINSFDLEVSQGINIFGSSDEGDAGLTRAAADPQFTKLEAQFQRLQRIVEDVNLLIAGSGQWSANPLFSSEEFAVGGINNGRGYDPSEVVGDDGIAGRLEIQWTEPVKDLFDPQYLKQYQVYSFWDIGRVWNQDATTSAGKRDSIASVGAGVRMNFTGDMDMGLALAFPMTREVQTQGDDDPKVYFNLNKRF